MFIYRALFTNVPCDGDCGKFVLMMLVHLYTWPPVMQSDSVGHAEDVAIITTIHRVH